MRKSMIANREGQSIVEVLVAFSVFVVSFMGIMALLNQSLALTNTVRNSYVASYLGGEGIELVKNLIDTSITQTNSWLDITGIVAPIGCYELDYTDTSMTSFGDCVPQDVIDAGGATPLLFDDKFYSYDAGQPTPYVRIVRVDYSLFNSDEMIVTSVVGWSSKGVPYSLTLEDHFYNWRP
jgi:hypothetical protein